MRPMFEAAKKLYGNNPVVGAEVGTSAGANAITVLNEWPEIQKLYCIDCYPTYSDFLFADDQARLRNCCVSNFTFEPKAHLIIEQSTIAAKDFLDGYLDFVYIDANHSYKYVKEDILAWMPKIKKHGIIGGHDYDWEDSEFDYELAVKKAVDEIFGTTGRVNYHFKLFTPESESYITENDGQVHYRGINSDWWVFL